MATTIPKKKKTRVCECPECGAKLNIGSLLRKSTPMTDAQREAARANGSRGGRPKGSITTAGLTPQEIAAKKRALAKGKPWIRKTATAK